MRNEAQPDLVINGMGNASGGVFHQVEINGRGKVDANLTCHTFRCHGQADVDGDVQATETEINGVLHIAGNLKTDNIKVSGKAEIKGNLFGENMRFEGTVTAEGDCEAEVFFSRGKFNLNGLLNAGEIKIDMFGHCKVKEIGGDAIHIWRRHKNFPMIMRLFNPLGSQLSADTIEGNDIHLEFTHAKVVRGHHVTIGQGCKIGRVEYRETFHKVQKAQVGSYKKT